MKIALLPLYLKLYDDAAPGNHAGAQKFADDAASALRARSFEVVTVPLCRLAGEFQAAVKKFEEEKCEVLVTLHTAYSPSLESIDALAGTSLPLVVFDTTPDSEFEFAFGGKLMLNHGIHGVQDLCNLLLRRGKRFLLCAGHYQDPSYMDRVERSIKAASLAYAFTHGRVGTVGSAFAGMGDFRVPEGEFGMQVVRYRDDDAFLPTEEEILDEIAWEKENFNVSEDLPEQVQLNTVKNGLKLRKWAEKNSLDAFTVNFLDCDRKTGFSVVPFTECSKAMARGVGYAGEGDVLTALLCGTLLKADRESTFTEMFCPDWKGNRIFLSHMGEMNLSLMDQKPFLFKRGWKFSDADEMALAAGCLRSGRALLV
ncbi:MAG: hypothetical protein J6A21_05225, partial [Lentisphaeria bacterium]|nr:hypothetical protein [Lentisphaeria bacterium]